MHGMCMEHKDLVINDRRRGRNSPQYESKFKRDRNKLASKWPVYVSSMKNNPKRYRESMSPTVTVIPELMIAEEEFQVDQD